MIQIAFASQETSEREHKTPLKTAITVTEVMQSKREVGWTTKKKCEKSEDPKALPEKAKRDMFIHGGHIGRNAAAMISLDIRIKRKASNRKEYIKICYKYFSINLWDIDNTIVKLHRE